ncbi:MAG: ABC transporter permease [Acidobacteria bacterium]|nr:ABC transporter permease [Acidobacteriota bacterium]
MDTKEAFRLALASLWANKLRTVLTLLGVVIGVASVIAVVTLVNGANAYVDQKLNRYGSDVFTVSKQPSLITSYTDYTKFAKRKNVQIDLYRAIADKCKRCVLVGAQQTNNNGTVKYGTESVTQVSIRGWTSAMPVLNNLDIAQGRTFTPAEEEHSAHVAIIGSDIEENAMKGEDPIGKEIRVNGVPYTVIGVAEKQGKTLGQSQDNWVAMPLETFQRSFGTQKSLTVYIKAGAIGLPMEQAMEEVRTLVRAERHDALGQPDSFELTQNDTFREMMKSITQWFAAIALPAAGISLVVGGIVIMNIMLVSVTERTREIGIRKALGARKRDVQLQFLIESGMMSLVGGVIGVLAGIVVAYGVTIVADFPASVALWSVIVGLVVSVGTGLFFGVYPARKAADLDPIVALRSEL